MLDCKANGHFRASSAISFLERLRSGGETLHLLQGNRLAERFKLLPGGTDFAVGETGFGTGLNFLCTWQLFNESASTSSLDFSASKNSA
jgi:tRNA 5-methylaminomethyl-2-thiouridine biosynthesis bifunctional protein